MESDSQTPIARRRALQTLGVAAVVWVAPSVTTLDSVSAATPSVPYVAHYKDDFQGAIGSPIASWSTVQTATAPADPNRRFLGQFLNDTVTVKIGGIPPHECLCIEFDLYLIESWDGNHPTYGGPDRITVGLDGTTLMSDSFGHYKFGANWAQTYGPAALNPPGTGAVEFDTLGYPRWGDQVVPISLCDFAHTADTAIITIAGSGLQSFTDENWGIDNFVVSYG